MSTRKIDSSAHLRSYPSIDSKRTLEGEKLFDYKHWKQCRDACKPTSFMHDSRVNPIEIARIEKDKVFFFINNGVAGVESKWQYNHYHIKLEKEELASDINIFDSRERWVEEPR